MIDVTQRDEQGRGIATPPAHRSMEDAPEGFAIPRWTMMRNGQEPTYREQLGWMALDASDQAMQARIDQQQYLDRMRAQMGSQVNETDMRLAQLLARQRQQAAQGAASFGDASNVAQAQRRAMYSMEAGQDLSMQAAQQRMQQQQDSSTALMKALSSRRAQDIDQSSEWTRGAATMGAADLGFTANINKLYAQQRAADTRKLYEVGGAMAEGTGAMIAGPRSR